MKMRIAGRYWESVRSTSTFSSDDRSNALVARLSSSAVIAGNDASKVPTSPVLLMRLSKLTPSILVIGTFEVCDKR